MVPGDLFCMTYGLNNTCTGQSYKRRIIDGEFRNSTIDKSPFFVYTGKILEAKKEDNYYEIQETFKKTHT
jgi:hypothetical protein